MNAWEFEARKVIDQLGDTAQLADKEGQPSVARRLEQIAAEIADVLASPMTTEPL